MSDLTAPGERPIRRYRSYLLRLWCPETLAHGWRASLEDPATGERIGFASLELLFAYLMEQVESDAKAKRPAQ